MNGDDLVIDSTSINILWGLDQSAGGLAMSSLDIRQTFTGRIGLERSEFVTSADGDTVDTSVPEYRRRYLRIKVNANNGNVDIGRHDLSGNPAGSRRIMLDLFTTQAAVIVHNTAFSSGTVGKPAVRLLMNHGSDVLHVLQAPGGVGVAIDIPGETSVMSKVFVADSSTSTQVFVGEGVTLTTWEQYGGDNSYVVGVANTTTTVHGGNLALSGTTSVTTLQCNGGTTVATIRHEVGSPDITTANMEGSAILDLTALTTAMAITTVNWNSRAAQLKVDFNVVTITTLNYPSGALPIAVA